MPGYGQTLWTPDEETVKGSQTARYMSWRAERGINATTYDELWQWSTDHIADFGTSTLGANLTLAISPSHPALTPATVRTVVRGECRTGSQAAT